MIAILVIVTVVLCMVGICFTGPSTNDKLRKLTPYPFLFAGFITCWITLVVLTQDWNTRVETHKVYDLDGRHVVVVDNQYYNINKIFRQSFTGVDEIKVERNLGGWYCGIYYPEPGWGVSVELVEEN